MKKLFISCPMKGRTHEAIIATREAMHKIAEEFFGEKLDVIENYIYLIQGAVCGDQSLYELGCSIQMMAEADYFIGITGIHVLYKDCDAEEFVARGYEIPMTLINHEGFAPCKDVSEVIKAYWEERRRQCN